jgi:deoxyribose-phosphate aldolase
MEGASRIGATLGARATDLPVAARIDHTLLKADATSTEVLALCDEAIRYRFASVCVNGGWVSTVAHALRGHDVLTCAVVGFPLGATMPEVKAIEARRAVEDGAGEIDMVMSIGHLKAGDYSAVAADIRGVVEAAMVPVKVILETALLSNEEIVQACTLAKAAGARFVKTSTGFGPSGASVDAVRLMRRVVGEDMSVKASGGIRNADVAQAMIEAGADRIGASASVQIAADAA